MEKGDNMGDVQSLLEFFRDDIGCDPELRKNAEIRLQVLLAQQQSKTASKLNILTFLLVIVGLLNAAILFLQVFYK